MDRPSRYAIRPAVSAFLPGLLAALALFAPLASHAADCHALLNEHLASDLALTDEAFDQDDHQGWRPLEDAGCDAEAAALIAAYAAAQAHPRPVLAWHRAQMLARAGDIAGAIEATRQTLRPPHSDDESGFDWNDYANATIAFLQRDSAALRASRALLAEATSKSAVNAPNLKAVDRLQRCFDQPYKIAYRCP